MQTRKLCSNIESLSKDYWNATRKEKKKTKKKEFA